MRMGRGETERFLERSTDGLRPLRRCNELLDEFDDRERERDLVRERELDELDEDELDRELEELLELDERLRELKNEKMRNKA